MRMLVKKYKIAGAVFALSAALAVCGIAAACSQEEKNRGEDREIAAVELDLRNAKTEFYVGESFSTLGLGIAVTYTDGTTALRLADGEDCSVTAPALDRIGYKTVAVRCGGFLCEYAVNVSEIVGLTASASVLGYSAGDEFAYESVQAALTVRSLDAEGKAAERREELGASEYTVEPPDLSEAGEKTVTVSCRKGGGTYTASFGVYAVPAVDEAHRIGADGGNGDTLTLYFTQCEEGGAVSADGAAEGWFLLVRRDGSFAVRPFSAAYTASEGETILRGEGISGAAEAESASMTVTAEGISFEIVRARLHTVAFGWNRILTGVGLDLSSVDREYVAGERFDAAGLRVIRYYSDGSSESVDAETEIDAPTEEEMNAIGVKEIAVRYTDETGQTHALSYQIFCIPEVEWSTNRLEFGYDAEGSGATLELFVTERSASAEEGAYWGTEQTVRAWLLVRNADGTFEMYEYEYYLGADVQSHPYPNGAPEGISSRVPPTGSQYGDNLVIVIRGRTFVATDNDHWHLILIGWQ